MFKSTTPPPVTAKPAPGPNDAGATTPPAPVAPSVETTPVAAPAPAPAAAAPAASAKSSAAPAAAAAATAPAASAKSSAPAATAAPAASAKSSAPAAAAAPAASAKSSAPAAASAAAPAASAAASTKTTAPADAAPAAAPAAAKSTSKATAAANAASPASAAATTTTPVAGGAAATTSVKATTSAKKTVSAKTPPSKADGTWVDVASNPVSPTTPTPASAAKPSIKVPKPQTPSAAAPVSRPNGVGIGHPLMCILCYLVVVVFSIYGPAYSQNFGETVDFKALAARALEVSTSMVLTSSSSSSSSSSMATSMTVRAPPAQPPTLSTGVTFNTYSLPDVHTFTGGDKLVLRAAGMRKKFFISVYSVGLYFSDKMAVLVGKSGAEEVAENKSGESLGLLLKFERDVEVSKIVEAFMAALQDDNAAYNKDKAALRDVLTNPSLEVARAGKYKRGDTIEFSFSGKQGLGVSVNRTKVQWVNNALLRRRLMEVYTGKDSVVPEIVTVLKSQKSEGLAFSVRFLPKKK